MSKAPAPTYDPDEFAQGLATKLSSRQRHVVLVSGAGTSKSAGLRDMASLKADIHEAAMAEGQETVSSLLNSHDLEPALTRVGRIRSLLVEQPEEEVLGLTKAMADSADSYIRNKVTQFLGEEPTDVAPHSRFAAWAAHVQYERPLEVFTLNYDLLFEKAFDRAGVPYFDGFLGDYEARFRADLVDPGEGESTMPSFFARVWKLHGSLSWRAVDGAIVRREPDSSAATPAAIYPSEAKYEASRRSPYLILQDRLRRSLLEPETIAVVVGYGFGDDHINEMIFDAVRARPRSEYLVLAHREVPDIARQYALDFPNLLIAAPEALVIGGREYAWATTGPNDLEDYWKDSKFRLGDFGALTSFLVTSSGASLKPAAEAGSSQSAAGDV